MPIIFLALLLGVNLSAEPIKGSYSEDPAVIEINAYDHEFGPNIIQVSPGESVRLRLTNRGKLRHGIHIDLPEKDYTLRSLASNSAAELVFKAPVERGEYEFYCPVHGHKMTGKLMVTKNIIR